MPAVEVEALTKGFRRLEGAGIRKKQREPRPRPWPAERDFVSALVVLAFASVSFVGIGMMTAVLPLISAEKGSQLGFIAQGMLLVVSGVCYRVEVLLTPMQWIATISPATYALEGIRAAILEGADVGDLWGDIWPLMVIGIISIPAGLLVFRRGERYAKKHGKLKRSG